MSNTRRTKLTSDSDDSTEDLIIKDDPSPHGMLTTEPSLNYVVEVPNYTSKKKCQSVNKTLFLVVLLLLLVCTIFIYLYFHERHMNSHITNKYCTSGGCVESAAFIQSSIKETVNPCKDFYQFACGGWLSKNPIPDNKIRWSIDSVLHNKNMLIQRSILENASVQQNILGSVAEHNTYKLYQSCMNMTRINRIGTQPLTKLLKEARLKIDQSGDKRSKIRTLMHNVYNSTSITSFFDVSVGIDDKNSKVYVLKFSQAGLSLPMFRYKNSSDIVIKAYKAYLIQLYSRLNQELTTDKTTTIVNDVLTFERQLYKIFVPMEERTTIDKTYHRSTLANLDKMVPMVDWTAFMKFIYKDTSIKINSSEVILIPTLKYFQKLQGVLENTSFSVIKNHALLHVAAAYADLLTDDIILMQKNLSIAKFGVYEKLPRWKRCLFATDNGLGMALGGMFVKKAFAQKSKTEANSMVKRVRDAFTETLSNLDWMDSVTQKAAKAKAQMIAQKIGYPHYILDPKKLDEHYKGVNLNAMTYFENVLQLTRHHAEKDFFVLRDKVNKMKWFMTPPTINAYYSPSNNQIVFPAGILQPPYFKADYPKVVNYGGMGSVIGHEITHGFDNDGRLYDKFGNYHGINNSWWTKSSVDGFEKKKKCFVDQYQNFIVVEGKHIKGNVTLGENIADNGGLKASYKAYKTWVKENGEEALLPGLKRSNDQVFFIAFAQSWCSRELRSMLVEQIEVDVHSPEKQRVIGSLQNEPDFAKAFSCPSGSYMNPVKKCSIW
ncbi:endothelin-converting enzyme homolog [Hydractinia symbiolongicarpus]|uniref:endothelin-converting enzyme homolog n=1 Tax=Hydractinia symbiolongicarpus TaxID=13093 RepID=UPI00254DCC39|nr:endothelin-converting enzyme homolog [Hydractinia symbiolongicarpus]